VKGMIRGLDVKVVKVDETLNMESRVSYLLNPTTEEDVSVLQITGIQTRRTYSTKLKQEEWTVSIMHPNPYSGGGGITQLLCLVWAEEQCLILFS